MQAEDFVLLKRPKTLLQASQAEEFELRQSNHKQIRQGHLGLYHQTLSNDMPFASLPCKGVLLAITKFVALLYDNDNVEEARV